MHRSSIAHAVHQVAAPVKYDEFQRAVIECDSKNVVASAFAGAGKTTTAVGYTEARKSSRFLYLCFGKANQLAAEARFGSHVECRTGHSLAYAAVGHRFKDQIVFDWSPRDFAAQLRLPSPRTAAVVQGILGHFFASIDLDVQPSHAQAVAEKWDIVDSEIEQLTALAKLAWARMQQPGSGVGMPHDAYFKIWALSNPKLTKYTHIVLDEAQDTNPVTAQLVERQSHATKLLIGDRHQSIFLFRGAVNAMEHFIATGATAMDMPRTWRFGPQIAGYANELLHFFKDEQVRIIGAGPGSTRRAEQKKMVLSRTNAGLFGEAAAVMGKNTHWLGGIGRYKTGALLDAYFLKVGRRTEIRDAGMRSFASWQQYTDNATKTRDGAARMLIKLNEQYGKDIPYLVKCFEQNALPTEAGARLVLSTTHNAKGMESDHVQIGEDFEVLEKALDSMKSSPQAPLSAEHAQEVHLLYVAITRARHKLDLNKETSNFLANIARHRGDLQEARARTICSPMPAEAPHP